MATGYTPPAGKLERLSEVETLRRLDSGKRFLSRFISLATKEVANFAVRWVPQKAALLNELEAKIQSKNDEIQSVIDDALERKL